MEQLPKSVRERLAVTQGRDISVHPDADTLNAFAEGALLIAERERVMAHLAVCSDCRDILALSLPEEAESELVRPAAAEKTRAQRRWTMFQWAGIAAAVVVVSAIVLLYESKVKDQGTRAAEVSATEPALPKPASKADTATLDTQAATRAKTSRSIAELAPYSADMKVLAKKAEPSQPALAKQKTEVSSQAAQVERDEARPFAIAAEQSRQNVVGGLVSTTNSVANAPASPRRVAGGTQMQNMQMQAAPVQSPQAAAPPPSARSQRNDKGESFGNYAALNNATANVADATVSEPALGDKQVVKKDSASAVDSVHGYAPTEAKSATERSEVTLKAAAPAKTIAAPVSWRISDAGSVERSVRNGVWQSAISARDVRFRTVATFGRDVWAGGSNGALYHSRNGGNSWTRVAVAGNGQMLTGDVIHIEVSTDRKLQIASSTGQTWTTQDGGLTWTPQ